MTPNDASRAVELMFCSPSPYLTVEFQGGEPLLAFDRIRQITTESVEVNRSTGRHLRFVLCSNLVALDENILSFLEANKFLISTSLDGPEWLHQANRCPGSPIAFNLLKHNIARCREALGEDSVSALLTVTLNSLDEPEAIVQEYLNLGFRSIFLRTLNPFGKVLSNFEAIGYSTDEFLAFYKRALRFIIELNLRGTHFVEEFARIILTKILTPFPHAFTDLQSPNGAISGVLVYGHDGYVYASDEARMLAAQGDHIFRLGHVQRNTYSQMVLGETALGIVRHGINESLPGCSECAFQAFCGGDPIRNYAIQGDIVGYRPTSEFCARNRGVIEILFELMSTSTEVSDVFHSWVYRTRLVTRECNF